MNCVQFTHKRTRERKKNYSFVWNIYCVLCPMVYAFYILFFTLRLLLFVSFTALSHSPFLFLLCCISPDVSDLFYFLSFSHFILYHIERWNWRERDGKKRAYEKRWWYGKSACIRKINQCTEEWLETRERERDSIDTNNSSGGFSFRIVYFAFISLLCFALLRLLKAIRFQSDCVNARLEWKVIEQTKQNNTNAHTHAVGDAQTKRDILKWTLLK